MIVRAEIWKDGKYVTGCDLKTEGAAFAIVVATDKPVADGNYEIRRGELTFKVKHSRDEWLKRA